MRKILLLETIFMLTSIVVIASNMSMGEALKNCSPFTESGVVNTEGMAVQSTKRILGWQDNKCVYKENLNISGTNVSITCKFTEPQIQELSSVMEAYDLINKYSNENIDTSSINAVQNNPVVKAWSKYLNNSSICKIEN